MPQAQCGRSFENRRRQAGRARGPGIGERDMNSTPALTRTNKVTLLVASPLAFL